MHTTEIEDVRDTAIKLDTIYSQSPTDYAYLKGWIHCLIQKKENDQQPRKPPENRPA